MKPLYVKKDGIVQKISGIGMPASYPAENVTYSNSDSGLTATYVQDAIDELAAGGGVSVAANTTYDNTTSGLTADDVQDAIDELSSEKVDASLIGANNGVAELDQNGKVPSSQLPSYVDDVIEVEDYAHLPNTGESGKIYVTLDDNLTYRWSGTGYTEISASLALGETSSTAYRGDRGKTAYDHATDSSRLTTSTASGLYKVAATAEGHIASLTAVQKADITALGIPGEDTNTTYTFENGTNGFKVTPSGGSAQTVTVTPSITNNVTGSGTSGYLTKFNGANTITNGPALGSSVSSQTQSTKFLREDGVWSAPTYTTNTDTKVTSSANHYAPATVSGQDKTASASGATAAWSIDVVKGVTLNTDGKGHVTGLSVTSGKIPANPNTDVKVTQTATSGSANYEVLFSVTADNTTRTEGARKNSNLLFNPSTGNLQTTQLNGVAIGTAPKFTDTNTTYTIAAGDSNGQIKVTPSSGSAYNVSVKGLNTAAYAKLGNTVMEVGKSTSRSTATVGTWTAMCNSAQAGNPTLPTASKWWNVISLNNWTDSSTAWVSQLAVATHDTLSGVWWRTNNASGTSIDSSTWHRLAEGDASGNASNALKVNGLTLSLVT